MFSMMKDNKIFKNAILACSLVLTLASTSMLVHASGNTLAGNPLLTSGTNLHFGSGTISSTAATAADYTMQNISIQDKFYINGILKQTISSSDEDNYVVAVGSSTFPFNSSSHHQSSAIHNATDYNNASYTYSTYCTRDATGTFFGKCAP